MHYLRGHLQSETVGPKRQPPAAAIVLHERWCSALGDGRSTGSYVLDIMEGRIPAQFIASLSRRLMSRAADSQHIIAMCDVTSLDPPP